MPSIDREMDFCYYSIAIGIDISKNSPSDRHSNSTVLIQPGKAESRRASTQNFQVVAKPIRLPLCMLDRYSTTFFRMHNQVPFAIIDVAKPEGCVADFPMCIRTYSTYTR